nr:unnamed protein product [Digitaria exilis]
MVCSLDSVRIALLDQEKTRIVSRVCRSALFCLSLAPAPLLADDFNGPMWRRHLIITIVLVPCMHCVLKSQLEREDAETKINTNMVTTKACILLFTAFFFSGLMELSMAANDKAPVAAAARAMDAKAIDQAIAYLLMFAALFVTYFAS